MNVSLIGTGYWGKKLQPYIEEEFNLKHLFDSKSELRWDVDAVVIATPNETHYSLAKLALSKGKHVLVEKPLGTFRECLELRDIALSKELVLMTDYPYSFSKSLLRIKSLIDPTDIDITINRIDRFEGRNPLQVLGSHALSILDIFAPLNSLTFKGNTFKGKVSGRISVNLKKQRKTRIILEGQGKKITHELDEPHLLCYVMEHFARSIRGEVQDNLSLSLNIARILEEICQ